MITDYDGLGRRVGEKAKLVALERYHAQACAGSILTALGLS